MRDPLLFLLFQILRQINQICNFLRCIIQQFLKNPSSQHVPFLLACPETIGLSLCDSPQNVSVCLLFIVAKRNLRHGFCQPCNPLNLRRDDDLGRLAVRRFRKRLKAL